MRDYTIEFRVDVASGLRFQGIDEINTAIGKGARIVAIGEGEGIFEKSAEQQGNVRLAFCGCRIRVTVQE